MKTTIIPFSYQSDVSIQWDHTKKEFIVSSASYRLPAHKDFSLQNLAVLSRYLNDLQKSITPLTEENAGKTWVIPLSALDEKIRTLQTEGFKMPKNILERVKKAHAFINQKEESSWMERKKALKSNSKKSKL